VGEDEVEVSAEDERPPSPAEALKLIEAQQSVAAKRLVADPLLFYGPWGLAWLVGFGAIFLRSGLNGEPYVPLSRGVALAIFGSCLLLAMVATAYNGRRFTPEVRGVSRERGMMYGLGWFVGFLAMEAIGIRFSDHLPVAEQGLLWSSLSVLVVAIMYLAGAAIWREWSMFFLGIWLALINVIGVAAGPGWHALLIAVAGGGGFLATGAFLRRRWGRADA
jgi:hypothetical protein